MANQRTPGPIGATSNATNIDAGTLCRRSSPIAGPTGLAGARSVEYSYSISGTVGALGSMLFTEGMQRLPGTWYDRTRKTTQLRANEAALGSSEVFDADAHKSARRTIANINAPACVNVDIHFVTNDGVENITVRGRRGTRSFCFDFKKAEEAAKKLPKDADFFQLFYDTIEKIVAAVKQTR